MMSGRPLFPAPTADEQLNLIFKILGCPTKESWPGIEKNATFEAKNYPQFKKQPIIVLAPRYCAIFRFCVSEIILHL